jgi:hypothetical protein
MSEHQHEATPNHSFGARNWIAEASDVCQRAAQGDLEARVLNIDDQKHASPDMPELLHAINHLLDMTDAFVREATASLEFAGDGKFFRRVLLAGMRGSFARAAGSINAATAQMEQEKKALDRAHAQRLELEEDFNKLREVVRALADATGHIDLMSKTMAKLASQTSLLSINASIEAARVGDMGRGFGVVASEVKKLATQAASASSEIQGRVRELTGAAKNTSQTIEQIWTVIRDQGSNQSENKAA